VPLTDANISPQADPATDAGCPAAAGTLTLYVIPPPHALDWSTPNHLLDSVVESTVAGNQLVSNHYAQLSHEIGHVNLELRCGDSSIPLTGQTGGGSEWKSAGDGLGVLLRDFPGSMNDTAAGGATDTATDIALRQSSGELTRISFSVNQAMCDRLQTFVSMYEESTAPTHYSGVFRARRFEGAGCAIFAAAVVDVGGLLRRSLMTPAWARTEMIGSARIADFLGKGYYSYGSNLVARDSQSVDVMWPRGVNVPASAISPVIVETSVLNAWSGPQDSGFAVPGLTGELQTAVPFTLYDPEMMADWAQSVWQAATANATASAFGVTWTAGTVEQAHEITYDARCVQPQTIAFEADNDDLFADSDAP
jgi:hypothetical protein